MDRLQPVLVLAGRTILGTLLALVFSMTGLGVAWGLFIFSGSQSATAVLVMLLIGAGLGAGLAGFMAWLRLDRNTRLAMIGMLSLTVVAGVFGAWGGYEFGAYQDVNCCDRVGARPALTPVTYTAFGATLAANGAALLLGLTREIVAGRLFPRRAKLET